ncbi:MAG: hypothetical protein KJN94_08375, partial [Gammaproteobacteria bacterium]|nr:hypothetical protein [Gammaproteobacteria bacterium]
SGADFEGPSGLVVQPPKHGYIRVAIGRDICVHDSDAIGSKFMPFACSERYILSFEPRIDERLSVLHGYKDSHGHDGSEIQVHCRHGQHCRSQQDPNQHRFAA